MKTGFVKVAAATPKIRVADCEHNANEIISLILQGEREGAKLIVFPELCITGYTCGDLFRQQPLLNEAKAQLLAIAERTADADIAAVVGLPLVFGGKLFNAAAVLNRGEVIGLVPKTHIPTYHEFYEGRHFSSAEGPDGDLVCGEAELADGVSTPICRDLVFVCEGCPEFSFAVELCEDLWVADPPSTHHAAAGANILLNLSASDEVTGKDVYRRSLVTGQSARTISAYVYADAGEGESSTDFVYAGHNLIAENGNLLSESERFSCGIIYADIDLDRLVCERRNIGTYRFEPDSHDIIEFEIENVESNVDRHFEKTPFVPSVKADREKRCEEILSIQSMGLKKRLEHTGSRSAVIGISGGLDSTLALLVTARAFDMLGLERSGIRAVTMPGFGTTDRTHENATSLVRELGATLMEINISEAVSLHFDQIGHNRDVKDVTYENSQARQRTYLLMDIANETGGLVIGTGDMSELALGWSTYNGDHMSMYGVNAGVPKTLVRYLVGYFADTCGNDSLSRVLRNVLETPVSPELLPPDDSGGIAQKTEDIVGPYELHDFFLYYVMRFGYEPSKILFIAKKAFEGEYEDATIKKWLKVFYRRFFSQQFKRSCMPDGPKVGSVALSPRGDLRMPSDACAERWLKYIE